MHMLEPDFAEQEQEIQVEPLQAKDPANTELTEGKPRCIPPLFLDFAFNQYFMLRLIVD
jgi:hypothetical protein